MERHVLITGCSTGIGNACALRLGRKGWRVSAGVRRQEDADRLEREGLEGLRPVLLDVTDEGSVRRAVEAVAGEVGEGGLAALVNNAGIVVPGPIEMLSRDDLRRQLEVNVVGVAATIRACLPLLREARGRIVNMSSVSGRMTYPFLGAYSASKFGLEALSDALRIELRPWGIPVVCIEPGPVETPIWQKGRAGSAELQAKTSDESWGLYAGAIGRFAEMTRKAGEGGMPPERVAAIVEKALTVRRPRARYVPGIGNRMALRVAGLIPTRAWDWLVGREFGM